jgi:hypothetical protein
MIYFQNDDIGIQFLKIKRWTCGLDELSLYAICFNQGLGKPFILD